MSPPLHIRAPDHLGDGVLALPAMRALAELGPLRISGPRWVDTLYRDLRPPRPVAGKAALAVLLKPSFSAALRSLSVPRRVGLATDGRWALLTDAVAPGGRHRLDDYNRVARTAGATVQGLPRFPTREGDFGAAPTLAPGTVLLLPGSRGGDAVEWTGFPMLADILVGQGHAVAFAGGPAEEAWLEEVAGDHPLLPSLPLHAFAAATIRASAVVGNDSGLTHLAAAARRAASVRVDAVHVVCGGTDPARTAAPGARHWRAHPPPSCWPCYRKTCALDRACFTTSPVDVADALSQARRDGVRSR
jgi:heptosyltransferase II